MRAKHCMTSGKRTSQCHGQLYTVVFTGFAFLNAPSWKSPYLSTDQWMAVLQCTYRPTSPESLTCHLDWDSDRPPPTKCHLTTSLLSANGPFHKSPPLIFGTAYLHISHQHRRSRFSGSVLRLSLSALLLWLSYKLSDTPTPSLHSAVAVTVTILSFSLH